MFLQWKMPVFQQNTNIKYETVFSKKSLETNPPKAPKLRDISEY